MAAAALLFAATSWADQIVMKNGDRVSGSIVKKDAAALTIKSIHFGTVTLPWAEVESVKADQPLTVVLTGDQTVKGTLATSDGKIEVAGDGAKKSVAPAEIVALRNVAEQAAYERLLHPAWSRLWVFTGSLGIAGAQGNAETRTFTIPVTGTRVTRTDKTSVYFNFLSSQATVGGVASQTAQAVRGGWAYAHNLNPRLAATVFNDFEYDKFQSLDLRTVVGGGLVYHLWKKDAGRVDAVGGGDWNHENYGPPKPAPSYTKSSLEAYVGDDFAYKISKRLALTQTYRIFGNISDYGTYRQNFDFGVTSSLTKWLTWNSSISDRFNSLPVAGLKKNDFLYSTGLGFTFSR